MNADMEAVANAVLYEGYALYPYRRSALKNRQPWLFGTLMPPDYVERCDPSEHTGFQAQLLVCLPAAAPGDAAELRVRLRFLQFIGNGDTAERRLELTRDLQPETPPAVARLTDTAAAPRISQPDSSTLAAPLDAILRASVAAIEPGVVRVAIQVDNRSPLAAGAVSREQALPQAMAAAHCLLELSGGTFVSLLDPPAALRAAAAACDNRDIYPVLAGEAGTAAAMLCSPIILYDYPRIAPQSAGDLFDGLEIDEILSLRIQTLTEDEKREVRESDERMRAMLERTEALPPDRLLGMHGMLRPGAEEPAVSDAAGLRPGDAVRLRPGGRADIFDLALAGQTAIVDSIERDLEGRLHVAVVLDDDPGREWGMLRQIGHRFFFRPEEVERLDSAGAERRNPAAGGPA